MKKINRSQLRIKRQRRVRAKISGTDSCPRLSVFRSNKGVFVQVIDDTQSRTLVSAKLKEAAKKNDLTGATALGKLVAKKCLAAKIETVVFDRGGYQYHGKVKAIAEGAREGGLKL